MRRNLKVKEQTAQEALDDFCAARLIYKRDRMEFDCLLQSLLRETRNEAEQGVMRGQVRHLGEVHMLLSTIYGAVNHPDLKRRIAMYNSIADAINKYLGVKMPAQQPKRKRRKLLRHV